ncbi:MAG: hypothetical protein M1813_006365 [Trichoglossum hirsutum]|nr:MAG: hypothetical protein M1813_006365 [Trichoglossum hirsutum]
MAAKRDPRRPDLAIPYMEPERKGDDTDIASTMASTLPMAAMFTRNRMIGWTAVVFALQNWLAEPSAQKSAGKTPAYFSVGMAIMSLVVAYMPLFLPPQPGRMGTETRAPAPAPPGAAV